MARKKRLGRIHGNKIEMTVRVNGQLYRQPFDLGTADETLEAWLITTRKKYALVQDAAGGMAEKVRAYLPQKASLADFHQIAKTLELYIDTLKARDRAPLSVSKAELNVLHQTWLAAGLASSTVRKRRAYLRAFYNTMYPDHVSPVKGTYNPPDTKPEARGLNYVTLERILCAMAPGRSTKRGLPPRPSLSAIRARVISYVGIPQAMLKKVKPHHLDLTAGTVRATARKKGGGVEARTAHLTEGGLLAFRAFHAANAYGSFNTGSLNTAFKRGAARAGVEPRNLKMYDGRHSFLSQVYRVTRDLATVGRLGFHAKGSPVTARYAMGADTEVNQAAVAAFNRSIAPPPAPPAAGRKRSRKLATKVGKRSKSFGVIRLVAGG